MTESLNILDVENQGSWNFSFLPQEILIRAIIILVVGAVSIPIFLKFFGKVLNRTKRLHFIQNYLISSARIGLWFLLILIVADSIGIPVNSIFALMGVAGLAISLALQNTLSNLAGGLQVLVSKPFEVGDYIDTDQGSGTVSDIGLAYSKLTTFDNKEVLIPNHLIASSKIINYTAAGTRRVDVVFPVSYQAESQEVRRVILGVCEKIPQIHREPEPVVYLSEFGDSSLQFSLRVWTAAEDYWAVFFALMEQGRDALGTNGIEIPYNQLDVHLHSPEKKTL